MALTTNKPKRETSPSDEFTCRSNFFIGKKEFKRRQTYTRSDFRTDQGDQVPNLVMAQRIYRADAETKEIEKKGAEAEKRALSQADKPKGARPKASTAAA